GDLGLLGGVESSGFPIVGAVRSASVRPAVEIEVNGGRGAGQAVQERQPVEIEYTAFFQRLDGRLPRGAAFSFLRRGGEMREHSRRTGAPQQHQTDLLWVTNRASQESIAHPDRGPLPLVQFLKWRPWRSQHRNGWISRVPAKKEKKEKIMPAGSLHWTTGQI